MYGWSLRNPDDDFVLHGQSAPIRFKEPDYLSNSQRTLTTRSLSQNTLYSPDRYGSPNTRPSSRGGDYHLNLSNMNESLGKSSGKSVSFSSRKDLIDRKDSFREDFEEELQKLMGGDDIEQLKEENVLIGQAQREKDRQWYTRPLHLTKSSEYSALQSAGLEIHDVHKPDRETGTLGTNLSARRIISENFLDEKAKKTYPVTLADSSQDMFRTFSPPPSLKPTGSKSPTISRSKQRPKSAMSLTDPKVRASRDYLFLKAAEPSLMKSDIIASPYEYELAKLRMQKLRLEEEKLLEVKRQLELERIRGPTPKWYEIKGPQFHYEAKKNNELLKKKDEWQELFDYRNDLLRASREFSRSAIYQ